MLNKKTRGTAVALGNFDGLHLGHIKVLESAVSAAKEHSLTPTALLFDAHPRLILSGERPPYIISEQRRDEIIRGMGLKIIKLSFEDFRRLEPEQFVLRLYEDYSARFVCCGFNYRFGNKARGDTATLERCCERLGITPIVSSAVYNGSDIVSSTKIRRLIENGDIERANEMLGYEFSYRLKVSHGDERGRLLGFPTINQFFPRDMVTPRFGVYVSQAAFDGRTLSAVTNIGIRPTVETEKMRSETYIMGFDGDLYGETVEIRLVKFLRDERRFSGIDELKSAIALDCAAAREYFKIRNGDKNEKA